MSDPQDRWPGWPDPPLNGSRKEKAEALLGMSKLPFPAINKAEVLRRLRKLGLVEKALNQAQLAIDEYYNGDRQWAERWLLAAFEANRSSK